MEEFKVVRELFADVVSICDNIISLLEKQQNGEDVKKEYEAELGKFMIAMIKISNMGE